MQATDRVLFIILAVLFFLTAYGCESSNIKYTEYTEHKDSAGQSGEYVKFASFRDIPGVNDDEIKAIEDLQAQNTSFVYGVLHGTEAFYNAHGEIRGYSALFTEWLAELFDIPFEIHFYEWSDLLSALAGGKADFTGELTATDERRETYFMTNAIAERSVKYMRIAGTPPLFRIASERKLRYAFLSGTTTFESVSALSGDMFEFEHVFTNDYDTAYQMLKNDEIDAFFEENTAEAAFDIYGDITAEDFFPPIYSPVSLTTQNPAYAPVISIVQKSLENGGLRYLTELYNQGYREYMQHKLFMQLSAEETAYLQNNPVVKFIAESDNYPLCFYNAYAAEWQGIAIDVIEEIEQLTGLTFERLNEPNTDWADLMEMLESGEASMVSELIRSKEREGNFLWPKNSVVIDNYALLSKTEYRSININEILYIKVGLLKNSAHTDLFRSWFPSHPNTKEYNNTDAAFTALSRGEIDVLMASCNMLLTITNYHELAGYKANLIFDYTFNSTFGFNKEAEILCSVVDKSLELIHTDEISEQWLRRTYDYRKKLLISQMPWFIGVSALFLCILVLLVSMFQRKHHEGVRLEQLVHKRTLELDNIRIDLEHAVESEKNASQSKSLFLANMSHEIRTPLNAIIGMTSIGKNAADIERKDDCFLKVENASSHLLGVINDILDMSKIEANKFELSQTEFSFEKMLQQTADVINFKTSEKNQKFMMRIDSNIPKQLIGDNQRLAQVITNLLGNAVKFTPENGCIILTAQLLEENDGVCTIKIDVKDTGIGISPEQQKKLFQSFQQAENNTARKFGGTGLGLAISKSIVEMMGGKIWIKSALNEGATFSFTVKLRQNAENEQNCADWDWGEARILVIDEEPDVLKYFQEIADNSGAARCDTASNVNDALALLEKDDMYNLYFISWKIFDINSTECSEFAGKLENAKDSVVFMVPTAEWSEAEAATKKAGINKFLPKPLFPSDISEIITERFNTAQIKPEEEHNVNTAAVSFEGMRLLLVEDVEINREIVKALLEPTLLEIDCAVNGVEAVWMFSESPDKYNMIFMDVQMPEMDGYEATQRIRSTDTPYAKIIPIVAMTANVFREDVEKCLESGMNDHIGKPINPDEVLDMLCKYLPVKLQQQYNNIFNFFA